MENHKVSQTKIWRKYSMTRREFLRYFGIASSAITLSPFFLKRFSYVLAQPSVKVYMVKNGDYAENTAKLFEMHGGIASFIDPNDVVVLKCNGQWRNQGYTNTGVIKAVIDEILNISNFDGEIYICDNIQRPPNDTHWNENTWLGTGYGFNANQWNRNNNYAAHNWLSLAEEYQNIGKLVAVKNWESADELPYTINDADPSEILDMPNKIGWKRDFFRFHNQNAFLSYPVFESLFRDEVIIGMKYGVFNAVSKTYTGQNVKTIFLPTLNNHGNGEDNYAGVTSAIKSFFGATEIQLRNPDGPRKTTVNGHAAIHNQSFDRANASTSMFCGELVAKYIQNFFSPNLFITAAMWSGHISRTGDATETKTLLACTNPATLDYVACRDVISPFASWLDPDSQNSTRRQIIGCVNSGIGTITPSEFEIISYDFENPGVTRTDIDKMIRDFKAGEADEQDVKNMIKEYMEI